MLLALKRMCYFDEPTAGISVEEVPAILQVIENIKKHPESTIVLIEHGYGTRLVRPSYRFISWRVIGGRFA